MNNDHPLGDIDGTTTQAAAPETASIIDEVLDLNAFLAGDIRRAEKTAHFCTRPHLEADIEALNTELNALTDSQGRPLADDDPSLGDDAGRSAHVVNSELIALQGQYAAALATVRVRAMDEDDWLAFQSKHKDTLNDVPPYPAAFWEDLILSSQPMITMPGGKAEKISAEQLGRLRKALGHAAFNEIAQAAWAVNTSSGVSVPKSSLSSVVLRQSQRG